MESWITKRCLFDLVHELSVTVQCGSLITNFMFSQFDCIFKKQLILPEDVR